MSAESLSSSSAPESDAAALRALHRSETLFRSLWETTDDTVLIVDAGNRIRFANPAADKLFGHPAGSLAGTELLRLMPGRMRHMHTEGMKRHMATGERRVDWSGTRTLALHALGHELPVEIRFARIELDGEPLFVGFLRDITVRVQAEQALLEANAELERRVAERTAELEAANGRLLEADRVKSEFLASMSHELRTPLNSILGFTGVLLHGMAGPLGDEQRRQLGFVKSSGEHLLALINDLLDLSRIEAGRMELQPEPLDLAALAAEVQAQMRPLAGNKGLALTLHASGPLALHADRRKLYQVLLNLAANAIKFTVRGEVSLRVFVDAGAGEAVAEVRDTGIGIAAEQIDRLFEPFRQLEGGLARPHEGSGLGLHLTRRLLDLMGGRIEVRSEPGVGSCFAVRLPLPAGGVA